VKKSGNSFFVNNRFQENAKNEFTGSEAFTFPCSEKKVAGKAQKN